MSRPRKVHYKEAGKVLPICVTNKRNPPWQSLTYSSTGDINSGKVDCKLCLKAIGALKK